MNQEIEPTNDEYQLPFEEINVDPKKRGEEIANNPNPVILLLDRLDDPRNLGSIFRLADAGRVKGVYGFRMQKGDHLKMDRVSRQTADHIPYIPVEDMEEVHDLATTFTPLSLEYTNKSVSYHTYLHKNPCMLIIGNERRGVSTELLEVSQKSLHIPMLGQNSSMNVSVATGIVLFHLLNNMGKL